MNKRDSICKQRNNESVSNFEIYNSRKIRKWNSVRIFNTSQWIEYWKKN